MSFTELDLNCIICFQLVDKLTTDESISDIQMDYEDVGSKS